MKSKNTQDAIRKNLLTSQQVIVYHKLVDLSTSLCLYLQLDVYKKKKSRQSHHKNDKIDEIVTGFDLIMISLAVNTDIYEVHLVFLHTNQKSTAIPKTGWRQCLLF